MSSTSRSPVWKYFDQIAKNGTKFGKCKVKNEEGLICNHELSAGGGNTTTMRNHLKSIHKILINSSKRQPDSSSQPSIMASLSRKSLDEIIARAVVIDGMSLSAIPNSESLKCQVRSFGLVLPSHHSTIRKHLFDFYETAVADYKKRFADLKSNGQRFSITTDGWTNTLKCSRMLNVTLRSNGESFKLGLQSIDGSITSEIYQRLVKEKLLFFGIDFDSDVISSTHDGESMMAKYGRISKLESYLCLNHGFHLAIRKVLYQQLHESSQSTAMQCINASLSENEESTEEENEETDDLNYRQIFASLSEFEIENNDEYHSSSQVPFYLVSDLQETLRDARDIVKFFRASPVRNDRLQSLVIEGEGKQLKCLLDVEHRWNSILTMSRRLIRLQPYILEVLAEYEWKVPANLFANLQHIVDCLGPIEEAVRKLSEHQSDLLIADGCIKYVLIMLEKVNTELSRKLVSSIYENVISRRNRELVSLFKVLRHCTFDVLSETTPLSYSTKTQVISTANRLFLRLFNVPHDDQQPDQEFDELDAVFASFNESHLSIDSDEVTQSQSQSPQTLSSLIAKEIEPEPRVNSNDTSDLKNEFRLSFTNGQLTSNLQKLHNALELIDPTSTASEQVFSVASSFITKVRNRTEDDLLNVLVFLKYYLLKQDKTKINKKQKL